MIRRAVVAVLMLALLPGCGAESPVPGRARLVSTGVLAPGAMAALAAYDRLGPAQRIGQLFMVGVTSTGATPGERRTVRDLRLGNVFLRGHHDEGRLRTARGTKAMRPSARWHGVRPFVATDQEGGAVQALGGHGFRPIPRATRQARYGDDGLRRAARTWGRQLHLAGVNLDLAPVADVVPRRIGTRNAPIGRYGRQLGHDPARVGGLVSAFVSGMDGEGVGATLKHFPGLGRATANTDHAARVTDPTRRRDPFLASFAAGIDAGATAVMVSSATYPRLDDEQACFSPVVMRTMLRADLGFDGIVLSDSFDTAAVAHLPPGTRAVRFLRAGGTMVLDVDPRNLPAMVRVVTERTRTDPAFARVVRDAVLTVLRVKATRGLVSAG